MLLDNTTTDMTTDSNDHDIYDEDEEMTPTIDIENDEEVSEDDIVFENDYERMMEEFDESDEYEGNRGGDENGSDVDDEESSEETSDEDEIIDQPLNNEQMPRFAQSNEFTPYFNNITESLFFCWMQKHRICKLCYFRAYK